MKIIKAKNVRQEGGRDAGLDGEIKRYSKGINSIKIKQT